MKTVDMLAKYLSEWPDKCIRIFQGDDCVFYGTFHFSTSVMNFEIPQAIPGEALAGLMLSEDHGIGVTIQEWYFARMLKTNKNTSRDVYAKEKSDDDYMREHLYNIKLQCLHAALIQSGQFDKTNATNIAEAINAGFDAIK
ncbi:TPA: hypothetical protein NQE39_000105 [Klebsiella pneumoniae]|nr:hypothetical protein [Klebsiella pneumoniae]HCI9189511.1 hypothetical protein [Klebsiella pneumoniae]HCI9602088.1 hypothetical protein [Klebsiella pneumoniae]HCI9647651.1 hypothetical protein [Klebsiella pneumoniae]HCI9858375.1 hypothetical protein [Klebsiella pneumoniae]